MTIAKIREVGKKIKKKVQYLLPGVFPLASKSPGQMDYPVASEVLKRKRKIENMIEE